MSCIPQHNTQMQYIYSTQGTLEKLSISDQFACSFKPSPNLIPKYPDFNIGTVPSCKNKALSDLTPVLVGNNYFNKERQ
jgi:hypothetical protein